MHCDSDSESDGEDECKRLPAVLGTTTDIECRYPSGGWEVDQGQRKSRLLYVQNATPLTALAGA